MEISIKEFKDNIYKMLNGFTQPIVLLNYKNKVAMVTPYSPQEEMYQQAIAGGITWDEYRKSLLQAGFKNLKDHPEKIMPNHVIASENVENEKARVRLQEVGLRMMAARFFSGLLEQTKCPHCGTNFLPTPALTIDAEYLRTELPSGTAEEHRTIFEPVSGTGSEEAPGPDEVVS